MKRQEAYLASQFKYGEGLVDPNWFMMLAVTDNIERSGGYDKVLTVSMQA